MNIAILGPGAIGSTFALHFSRAGHDVTVVARGKRLEQLLRSQAIVETAGHSAPVTVATKLDETIAYDFLLVAVLAHQVEAVLPQVRASAARRVMFMFNTFDSLSHLREAVGASRFAFGFPAIIATLDDEGVLASRVVTVGQITTVSDEPWAELFRAAGIGTVVHDDMESWLRTHVAMMVPFMVALARAHRRQAGLSWRECTELALAMKEGFALVRTLGNRITPAPMSVLERLPVAMVALLVWSTTRSRLLRKNGARGMDEPTALIAAMEAVAPSELQRLHALSQG
ncbi:MAG: 2-dehydropantoate 2-reductase N-terminal domain-containing protein [Polyangiaceae bacterium]